MGPTQAGILPPSAGAGLGAEYRPEAGTETATKRATARPAVAVSQVRSIPNKPTKAITASGPQPYPRLPPPTKKAITLLRPRATPPASEAATGWKAALPIPPTTRASSSA